MKALTDIELDRAIADDVRAINAALADRQKHLEAVAGCEKSAVISAWRLGGRLLEKKKRLPHGGWLPWLESAGIGERSAQDYMRLATKIRSAADLGPSIRETLRALPKPSPTPAKRAPEAQASDVSTDTQPDSDPNPIAALEASLDAERATNEGLAEKLAIVEAQLDPGQLDQLDGLRAQIATYKSQVNSWMSKHAEATRSRNWWRRKAKQLEKQLAQGGD